MSYACLLCMFFTLIFANANEIICSPNEDCLLNCTNPHASCSDLTINATQSLSLTIYCNDASSCEYSTILCPPQSICHVECNGRYSCSDTIIHANRSSILQLYCTQHRSCFLSTIFGAQSLVDIDCSADRSCVSSTFHLNTTANVTLHCHHTDSTDTDNACSTNAFYVNNASYAHFEFDSEYKNEGGISNIIYGMHINHTLSIQCNGIKCSRDLDVYCPIHAQCIFITNEHDMTSSSLDIVQFAIPNRDYHHLSMHCISSTSATCSSVDQRIIRCLDTGNTSVIAYDDIDNKWHCFTHENHCCPSNWMQNSDDTVTYCHTTDCIVNCSAKPCAFKTVNATGSTSLTMYCEADYACQGSHVVCPSDECHVLCTSHYACQYMLVDGTVPLALLNIECRSAAYECQYMTVHTHMRSDANIRIQCGDEWSTRSCVRSTFNLHTLTHIDVDIACVGAFACYYSSWFITGINTVSWDCVSRSSCELSLMDAATSSQLNVLCDGRQACYANAIRCQSCSIQCTDYVRSCRYFIINIVSTDANLNLDCPLNPTSNYVCDNIETHCDIDHQTQITYEPIHGIFECSDSICCPWIPTQSPTIIPTTEPTIEPTLNPINPTMDPTIEPTLHPSSLPTSHPAWIPSHTPIHGPNTRPTFHPFAQPSANPVTSTKPTIIPTSKVRVKWISSTHVHTMKNTYSIIDKPEAIYILLVFVLLLNICLLICIVNCKYNLNKHKESFRVDDQKYAPVILYCVQVVDLYSDVVLSVQLYEYHLHSSNALYVLFVASIIFILLPYIANFCSSIHIVMNITHNPLIHPFTKQYFGKHSMLYIIGVLLGGGSFGTLQLLNTNLMGIQRLTCGLSTLQLQQFVSHKLWCTAFLQNLPNLLIQLYFIVELRVVTYTVIISNASTLFNLLLNVCIGVIVCVTRTSKDQQEVPFTIHVTWIPRAKGKEEEKVDFMQLDDPYQSFGNRRKLSLELNQLYDAMEFEILSSESGRREMNNANIYGVVKIDRTSRNKQKEIDTFLNEKEALTEAMISAFGYEGYFTDKYRFIVTIELNVGNAQGVHISKEMQRYLPHIWEGIRRESMAMSDEVFNQLNDEIQRLNDEGKDEVYTYNACHESMKLEMEMKRNLSHFAD
eukprot:1152286_1